MTQRWVATSPGVATSTTTNRATPRRTRIAVTDTVSLMERPQRRTHTWTFTDLAVLVVAVALLTLQVVVARSNTGDDLTQAIDGVAVAIIGLASIGALAAMRYPVTGTLLTLACTLAWYQIGYSSSLINIPHLLAFFFLGLSGDRRRQLAVGSVAVALTLIAMLVSGGETISTVISAIGWTAAAVLLGDTTYSRRALLAEYATRAVRAETEREAEAERRVAEARLEIARDLHDVLAHTVSFMTLQANVGRDALERGSGDATAAFVAIRTAGSSAIREVESLITMLRGNDGPSIAPVPGLDRIGDLLAAAISAGIDVTTTLDAGDEPVSGLTELTAYRIAQESISNAIRHSRARNLSVGITGTGSHIVIEIRNDGVSGAPSMSRAGLGLIGMRERTESIGGAFEAGPKPPDTWLVRAELPRRPLDTT